MTFQIKTEKFYGYSQLEYDRLLTNIISKVVPRSYSCIKYWHNYRYVFWKEKKTSTMWPSQNFLLYNGNIIKIKVNEWINNFFKKKYYVSFLPPPPLGIHTTSTNYNNLILKKKKSKRF